MNRILGITALGNRPAVSFFFSIRSLPMNPIRFPHVLVAAVCALGAVAAIAQPAPDAERAQKMQAELKKRFAAADANGDGRLTKDEANGKMPRVYQHFDEIDTAHSGAITLADIAAFARSQRGARKAAP